MYLPITFTPVFLRPSKWRILKRNWKAVGIKASPCFRHSEWRIHQADVCVYREQLLICFVVQRQDILRVPQSTEFPALRQSRAPVNAARHQNQGVDPAIRPFPLLSALSNGTSVVRMILFSGRADHWLFQYDGSNCICCSQFYNLDGTYLFNL
jgi:hypothetical protein